METEQKKTLIIHLIIIPLSFTLSGITFLTCFHRQFIWAFFPIGFYFVINTFLCVYGKRFKEFFTSQILSSLFMICLLFILYQYYFFLQLHLYIISLVIYHYGEYFGVLLYHFDNLSFSSYLIDQSDQWLIATGGSFIELIVENLIFHNIKNNKILIAIGILLLIVGHIFRMGGIYTGKKNFTHLVAEQKKKEHELVTKGIYSLSRHPSYFGFYLWSVGTQVMCVNPICIVGFTVVLYIFFKRRIISEEFYLISFFGQSYLEYRNKVPILIPCINLTQTKIQEALSIHEQEKSKLTTP